MKKIALLCGVLLLTLLWASNSFSEGSGRTLYVNNKDPACGGRSPCYKTIQAAVTAAFQGDVVQVQAGTYREALTIDSKNNFAGATEASRIVIEADTALPPGSVTLRPPPASCLNGQGVLIRRSKFVTLRGLTITGAVGAGVVLLGGPQQNQAIHIERSRIFGNSSSNCPGGGITVALGNPDTLILNTLIYGNGGNGITFADPGGGPHWVIQNTIHGNGWNGVGIVLGQTVTLANNLITRNGQASGALGGRYGISRLALPGQSPEAVRLLSNLICGNRLGEIQGPILDNGDSGNLTPQGTEGVGVEGSPGCQLPANVYADMNGADEIANTLDDDFSLADGSPAIDRGVDPTTLGLGVFLQPLLQADNAEDLAVRPQDGDYDRLAAFDVGALEFPGDIKPPEVGFLNISENSFVRQTITITARATDNINVTSFTLAAGSQMLPVSISPPLPGSSMTASTLWNTTSVSDGALILTAAVTDASGNNATAARSVIVDNTPPNTEITAGPSGQITETTATFIFAGSDNFTSNSNLVFAWRVDGGAFSPFTANTSITLTGFASGAHVLEVIARDLAGNDDPTPALRAFIVRPGPTITAIDPVSGSIGTLVTITGTDFVPGTTQVTFNGAPAVIRSLITTLISTTVPTNATAGFLTVTTPQGSASRNFMMTTSQNFALLTTPSSVQTIQGGSAAVLLDAVPSNGFGGLIQLTTGPLPAGVNAKFSTPTLAPNNYSLLTLSTSSGAPVGAHVVEIHASSHIEGQAVTRTAIVTLNVAAPGQTVLVGQVLDGEDRPLPGVSIKLGGVTLTDLGLSDAAGNLFIPLSLTGPQVFVIDGSSANTATTNYPTIPVTLNIQPSVFNELGYIPRLRGYPISKLIPIVPGQAAEITDPELPGFKMTIPAGVQIIGWDGQPNTQFGVTTVPLDRSPLPPLPPGLEARQTFLFSFGKVGGGVPTGNIPIDTPNDVGAFPGEQIELYYFNEAPDGTAPNQWEKYGTGTVSADGSTIVTDINPATGLPYGIPRFCCGARTNVRPPNFPTPGGGPSGGPGDGGKRAGEPVDTATGFFYIDKTDMVLAGRLPIAIARTYRTNLNNQGPFGIGTSWPFDVSLASPPGGSADALILISPGNRQDYFSRQSFTTFINSTAPWLRGAVLAVDRLQLRFKDGSSWVFDSLGRLQSQSDRYGNTIQLSRDGEGRIVRIGLFQGGELTLTYVGAGIESITDAIGRQVRYTYDELGRLESVRDPAGGVTRYTYDSAHRILTLTNARGITFLSNEYDSAGRVVRQIQADGGVWTFAYTSTGGYISQTVVTDPRGNATTYRFNAAGYQTSETDALGQTTIFERQMGTNLLLSVTDPLKRVTRFNYDPSGNLTLITDPAGNAKNLTHEATFNSVTSITDALGNVARFEYDNRGDLAAAVDPLGNRTTMTYNNYGEPISRTDPLGNATTFNYDGFGRLTDITDPLGNRSQRSYDAVFRLTSQTDPRGKVTKFAYDALSHITSVTDPLGGLTRFAYDANGNLVSVTDARGNMTAYTYDSTDRLATRTDPVGAIESFQYDAAGNLIRHIDRKNQQTVFSYDPLNRQIAGSFGDGANTSFVYDAVNRLIESADSAGGIIANQYDTLGRLAAHVSNLGTIRYEYDSIGRRTQMDVPGQLPVTYSYDVASRVRQVLQGTQIVNLNYDSLGRRTQTTLPNGVSTEYRYDVASRVTALIYRNALGLLGDLTYQYDRAGNRIGVGGSFARTLLPDPIDLVSYDAANRQRSFGDKAMSFDANGNLTSMTEAFGITTYSWDARNRLTGMSGPNANASFAYDVFGRRSEKTINAQKIQYLYDGRNPVQEMSGTTVLTNTLTGLGTDEVFSRTDFSGTQHFLTDALRSAVALADSSGTVQVEYAYEPFGRTVVYGNPTISPFQYTGRENDGTGLYYYRARYYFPTLQRFIAEDPIEFGGWDLNLYSYVSSSPINFSDPLGLFQWYGNWGGPDYTGGQVGSWNTIDRLQVRPAIDRQDECYKTHDLCYGSCRDNYSCNCPADRQGCFRSCDGQLSGCLKSLRGDPSHNLSAIVGGWLFDIRQASAECGK